MKFFRKSLSILLYAMVFFLLSPSLVVRAQQMIDSQRQTLITQIQQQIVQLQQQLSQILTQQQVSLGAPIRLKIPSINVAASIEYVGLTSNRAMDVPKGPANVAWFNLGPRPGGNGSAVIAGHYGWKNNIPAVFDNLHKLRKGDKIYVEDEKGANIVFVVREIQIYGKNDDASGVFGSSDGKAHLNLITCTGVWNKIEKTRTKRQLTEEEEKIVKQLRKDLDDAEKFVRKEIEDIEKEVK